MATIKPELAGGFRDYLPQDMIPRNKMLETIKQTFERFGFVPMDTPGMEKEEILAGDKTDFLVYRAGVQEGDERSFDVAQGKMALRYDLTVPLARFFAANGDKLPKPFKRYQLGRVWRGEKQQTGRGRYREFSQLDLDIVGSDSMLADAEIVAVMYETLSALGLTEFVIKVNNRKLLDQFSPDVLRTIDKLDKIGWEGVEKELPPDQCAEIKNFFSEKRNNKELDALLQNAAALGVPADKLIIDNTVIRGLGYYTGNIFEAVLTTMPELGSISSGGRYDNLIDKFAPYSVPAVGASVGIDRLFSALDQMGLLPKVSGTAQVLILNFDSACREDVQAVATQLRRADIATELYVGSEETFKGQLAYAVKQEYPLVVILGSEEKTKGVVQIKNIVTREQQEVSLSELVSAVRAIVYK